MTGGRQGIRPRRSGDEGQATAELALVLPFVVVLLLAVVQVGLVIRQQLLLEHAAHEGARAAAVADDSEAAGRRAALAVLDDPARAAVAVTFEQVGGGAGVRVSITWTASGSLPVVGPVVEGRTLRATVVMRLEP